MGEKDTDTETEVDTDSEFAEFTGKATPVRDKPMFTIQKKGTFSLNRAARVLLGDADTPNIPVVLLYNKKRNVIAVRRDAKGRRHSYPVRKQVASDTYLIAGQAFCSHNRIPIEHTRRYEVEFQETPAPTLLIDLNGEELPAQRGRYKNEQPPAE